MTDFGSFLLLSAAVFSGAFVSLLAGFAFSAVAGGILLHILQPIEAVPLMMSCSVGVQATSLWAMRRNIQWRQSLVLVIGGLLGVPIALWLLHTADTPSAKVLGSSSPFMRPMLFRPGMRVIQEVRHGISALIGFGGGLIGGLTAMPGALPTIWCDLHGMPKSEQRAMVQPFIAVMQIFALALMVMRHDLAAKVALDFALSIPALLAGTGLGILAFRRVNEVVFRCVILAVLMLSGVLLLL
ncbi:sulfite exporter TauE/SafE family protein [Bradyrhizobium sp. STM 3557]|uniref:sulfite exporter TauE/SafE family protein n=1 Tax=Bradyrhizobium sp. STM 3557 TaxID=578920 RepID=UPI00388D4D8E